MKLTTTAQVSVDGVMEGNGGQRQNRPGFERGGWARPPFDDEAMTFVDRMYQRADAFLFGRRTYELFASRDESAHRPGGRRPGPAAVPRHWPGHSS
jgi:dihydrofolate reductase